MVPLQVPDELSACNAMHIELLHGTLNRLLAAQTQRQEEQRRALPQTAQQDSQAHQLRMDGACGPCCGCHSGAPGCGSCCGVPSSAGTTAGDTFRLPA